MDISIYDNYSGAERGFDFFPVDDTYKSCDSLLAIICLRGRATFKVRIYDFEVRRCNSLVIGPDTPFYIVDHSADFHIDVVRIGRSVYEMAENEFSKLEINRLVFDRPLNFISEKKTRLFHIIHSYLKVLIREEGDKYRDMIIYEYLKIFFYEACHIMESSIQKATMPKRDRSITNTFFKDSEKHFRENRRVEFYAAKIGISPKHLAYTLKKTTGKYPSEWLEDYVLLEAKKILRSTRERIQDISVDLNFATPSHFSRFFKAKTGMTPKDFRNKTIE